MPPLPALIAAGPAFAPCSNAGQTAPPHERSAIGHNTPTRYRPSAESAEHDDPTREPPPCACRSPGRPHDAAKSVTPPADPAWAGRGCVADSIHAPAVRHAGIHRSAALDRSPRAGLLQRRQAWPEGPQHENPPKMGGRLYHLTWERWFPGWTFARTNIFTQIHRSLLLAVPRTSVKNLFFDRVRPVLVR